MRNDSGHSSNLVITRPVRVAVVGSGPFAEFHIQAFGENPDCELVAIVSRSIGRREELAQRFSVPHCYSSTTELIAAQEVDAVAVVTSGIFHLEPTIQALEAGASVLLEKPIVMNSAEGDTLQKAVAVSQGFVMPAHILRFASPYQELKNRLQAGAIGHPRALSFRRHRQSNHDEFFHDVHPALMTMIHDIDLAIWLTGSAPFGATAREIRVSSRSQPLVVWAEAETADGTVLSFQVSWSLVGGSIPDSLEAIGHEGALSLSLTPRVEDLSLGGSAVDDCLTPNVGHGALREEIRHFIDAIRYGYTPSVITIEEALVGIRFAESIIEAAKRNRNESRGQE